MTRILLILSLVSLLFASGCANMTPQQREAVRVSAGVLKALATVPLPPGVSDPQFDAWRAWGGDMVGQLEQVAEGKSPK